MLRFIQSVNADQARAYYTEGLSREDYYTRDQEVVGRWGGRGAALLGLEGAVARDAFSALCGNKHPGTGRQLTQRTRDNRRVGYDINFHAPKSVSLVFALTRDVAILNAFRESVSATMTLMEREMLTRVRLRGRSEDRPTGNMLWGEFVHFTSRPVDGVADPQLHSHCFAFNATFDEVEGRWKAGQFGELKADAPFFESVFHAELANRLREAGFEIERTAKGWELAGVGRSTLLKFSRRTSEIERLAQEKGITSAKAKDRLGAATRERKQKEFSQDDLRTQWEGRLTHDERAAVHAAKRSRGDGVVAPPEKSCEAACSHALAHAFERASAVAERKLQELALRCGVGSVVLSQVESDLRRRQLRREVLSSPINGRTHCTTAEVLREERDLIEFARAGKNACRALGSIWYIVKSERISEEQRAAVASLIGSHNRVTLLRGRAGVGKTTIMREAVAGIEAGGKKVFTFAPSAQASRGVLRTEGFADADTLARLLTDPSMREKIRNQVIWIDEAGLAGTKTLRQVFRIADETNARVVLSGDPAQHFSVERGDALRLLEERAGLKSPELKTIQRQKGAYREAVAALSDGRVAEGFRMLDANGSIREMDTHARHAAMVELYANAVSSGKSVLAISPTHAEGEKVSALLRDRLRRDQRIAPREEERIVESLVPLPWTEAERSDAACYESGMVVQFHRKARGFKLGERARVTHVDGGEIKVLKENGEHHALPLNLASRFGVFESKALPLAPGDQIRFTMNGRKHHVHNGSVHQLKAFTRGGRHRSRERVDTSANVRAPDARIRLNVARRAGAHS
jgi:conjugative relaxase-like TrwC/TraI family protein